MTEDALDADILTLGRRLAARTGPRAAYRSVQDRALAPIVAAPQLREALFRVVDVAPACAAPADLAEHFDALMYGAQDRSGRAGIVSRTASGPRTGAIVGRVIHGAVRQMAKRFIVAETVAGAAPILRRLWDRGVAVSVDLLGEASVSQEEAEAYLRRCDRALVELAGASSRWPGRPLLERDAAGPIPRVNLSVKVTALTPLVRAEAPERGRADLSSRLRVLMRRARDVGAHLHVDMEALDSRELTLGVVLDLLEEEEFLEGPSAGLVVQAYLRDGDATLDRILEWAARSRRAVPLTIRLVKGAYWDNETIMAAQHGWVSPVWSHKHESDRCFERLSRRLVDAFPTVRPVIASHNLRSVAHAIAYGRRREIGPADLEIQVLRGLGDDLQDAIVAAGMRARTYCPVGDMVAGMGYLVRRLLENSSNDGFVVSRRSNVGLDQLLRRP